MLTDQTDDAIAALEEALACQRELGDKLRQGDLLAQLAMVLWCPGRTLESGRAARHAVALLEELPPGRELAQAYLKLSGSFTSEGRTTETIYWAERSYELAENLGEAEISLEAHINIALCQFREGALEEAERVFADAQEEEFVKLVGEMFMWLGELALSWQRLDEAAKYIGTGFEYCSERGLELYRLYLLAYRARLDLCQGRWSAAAEAAEAVLRIPRASTTPRIAALVVLALVRARRGDPGHSVLLEEAWALAAPTGELHRVGPVAAAMAEVAWLAGDREEVVSATNATFELAVRGNSRFEVAELATWRRRAGLDDGPFPDVPSAHVLELTGEWAKARKAWLEMGCPYEAALAVLDCGEEGPLRMALDELQSLDARPAAAIVARRLRDRGALSLPRGPRPATRQNQFGLTRRELDVLALVNAGSQNREIADQLVLSVRTVEHHVEPTIRKLGVHTRAQTRPAAEVLGLSGHARQA